MRTKKLLRFLLLSIIAILIAACDDNGNRDLELETRPTPEQIAGAREVQAELFERLEGILSEVSPEFYPWVSVRGHGEYVSSYSIAIRIAVSAQCIIAETVTLNYLYTDILEVVKDVIEERSLIVRGVGINTSVGYRLSLFFTTSDFNNFSFAIDDNEIFDGPVTMGFLHVSELSEFPFANILSDYFNQLPYW